MERKEIIALIDRMDEAKALLLAEKNIKQLLELIEALGEWEEQQNAGLNALLERIESRLCNFSLKSTEKQPWKGAVEE